MLTFLKPKLEFNDLNNQDRLHHVLEKYLWPELSQLGFEWTKEVALSDDTQQVFESEISRALLPHEKFIDQFFHRTRGEIIDKIIISRDEFEGRLMFSCDWEISYEPYEKWHTKTYREKPYWNSIYGWSDTDDKVIDHKFRKKHAAFFVYDLSRFSTDKLMQHFLDQTKNIRIPQLEKYESIGDAIALLESLHDSVFYSVMFDFYMIERQYKKAGSILHWAEMNFRHEDSNWKADRDFNMRLKLLKSKLKKGKVY